MTPAPPTAPAPVPVVWTVTRAGGPAVEEVLAAGTPAVSRGPPAVGPPVWTVVPAQAGGAVFVLGLLALVLAILVVYGSVEIVDATERAVLVVLGERQAVLEPGINFVPPFVSRTHAYDVRPQELERTVGATTADGTRVEATVGVVVAVEDVTTLHEAGGDYREAVENGVRAATTAVLAETELDAAPSAHREVERAVRDRLASLSTEYGVELREVDVLDVVGTDRPDTGTPDADAGDGTGYGTDFGTG